MPYLGECRLPNGVKSYPVREMNGMVLVFPGNPALAEARLPAFLGKAADRAYKTRRLNREVACHYSFLHENLFDMNHQFLHRKNMGSIKARCLGRRGGETWCEVDYTFSRTEGRQSVGEAAILSAMRPGDGNEIPRPDDHPHRISLSAPEGLGGRSGRAAGAGCVAVLHAAGHAQQRTNRTFGFLSVKKVAASA